MSKYSKRKRQRDNALQIGGVQPWISLKSGRRIIIVVSIGMAVLTAWQVIPQRGIPEGILWGLFFGGLIWLIFEGYYRLTRLLRRFH